MVNGIVSLVVRMNVIVQVLLFHHVDNNISHVSYLEHVFLNLSNVTRNQIVQMDQMNFVEHVMQLKSGVKLVVCVSMVVKYVIISMIVVSMIPRMKWIVHVIKQIINVQPHQIVQVYVFQYPDVVMVMMIVEMVVMNIIVLVFVQNRIVFSVINVNVSIYPLCVMEIEIVLMVAMKINVQLYHLLQVF
jgi:hypothetical protein